MTFSLKCKSRNQKSFKWLLDHLKLKLILIGFVIIYRVFIWLYQSYQNKIYALKILGRHKRVRRNNEPIKNLVWTMEKVFFYQNWNTTHYNIETIHSDILKWFNPVNYNWVKSLWDNPRRPNYQFCLTIIGLFLKPRIKFSFEKKHFWEFREEIFDGIFRKNDVSRETKRQT